MKIGVIDVGGGLRGIYAVGVFDYCMDHDIRFDLGIGVSAGSANLASYAAGQRGRNHQFYTEYAFRKQYMSMRNFILKHSFIDLDYVYGTLSQSDGENPLDYCALRDNPMEFHVVATMHKLGRQNISTRTTSARMTTASLRRPVPFPLCASHMRCREICITTGH